MVTVSDRAVRLGSVLLAFCLALLVLSWADLESRDIDDLAIRRLEAAPLAAADVG